METAAVKTKWSLDPAHSELMFKVRHMMISSVKGEFTRFEATVEGEDFEKGSVRAIIDPSSITTNENKRDEHLRSADFFDAVNHKEIVFESTSFKKEGGNKYKLSGNLTMKGITKPVTLDVEFGGIGKDPWGNEKAGFSISGKINRKEWGLNWNTTLESGGVLVSEEVQIMGDLQFVKK